MVKLSSAENDQRRHDDKQGQQTEEGNQQLIGSGLVHLPDPHQNYIGDGSAY